MTRRLSLARAGTLAGMPAVASLLVCAFASLALGCGKYGRPGRIDPPKDPVREASAPTAEARETVLLRDALEAGAEADPEPGPGKKR